jgi:hypothetical protein
MVIDKMNSVIKCRFLKGDFMWGGVYWILFFLDKNDNSIKIGLGWIGLETLIIKLAMLLVAITSKI